MKRWMKRIGLTSLLVVVGLSGLYALGVFDTPSVPPTPAQAVEKPQNPPTKEELLRLVNEERAKVGVAPLTAHPMLEQSAQWKADDMARYEYFGHVKPGETGNNGLDYLARLDEAEGDKCSYISENISEAVNTSPTAMGAVNGWINSEPHYKAMIDPKYTLTGFGINGTKITQHFCQQ